MVSATFEGFSPREASDRNFFLLVLAAIWAGVIAGFLPDTFNHITGKHAPWAAIVHVHAATYLGWLALLTVQMSLVRSGRTALHRRLGVVAVFWIPWMVIVGLWAFKVMGKRELGTPDGDAAFLILPSLGVVAFATVAGLGLAFRRDPSVHKRLMLLATAYLADAGFARWIAPGLTPLLIKVAGHGFASFFVPSFIGSDLIMAAVLLHDVASRGRVHPVVAGAVVFLLGVQVAIAEIYLLPAWAPIATRILQA